MHAFGGRVEAATNRFDQRRIQTRTRTGNPVSVDNDPSGHAGDPWRSHRRDHLVAELDPRRTTAGIADSTGRGARASRSLGFAYDGVARIVADQSVSNVGRYVKSRKAFREKRAMRAPAQYGFTDT